MSMVQCTWDILRSQFSKVLPPQTPHSSPIGRGMGCLVGFQHDDVITWKKIRVTVPLWGSPVNSLHKGQWRGDLVFSLMCASTNGCANRRDAGVFETPSRSWWRHCNRCSGHMLYWTDSDIYLQLSCFMQWYAIVDRDISWVYIN